MPRIALQILVIAAYFYIFADFYQFNKVHKISKIELAIITSVMLAMLILTEVVLWGVV